MNRSKDALCLLLTLMLVCSAAFAEEPLTETQTDSSVSSDASSSSTGGETPSTTEGEPTGSTEGETGESTEGESKEPTDPTEPTNPTDPTDPTAPTDPTEPEDPNAFYIFIGGTSQKGENENVWKIFYQSTEDLITFSWTAMDAAVYEIKITDGTEADLYTVQMTETTLSLPASTFAESTYVLNVIAYDGSENPVQLASAGITFALVQGQPTPDDGGKGFPSGDGHRGGSFPSGGMPDGMGEEEQGLKVTPGEALTNSHTSGTKSMTAFDAVEVVIPEETETVLTLNGTELDVTLDDVQSAFSVTEEEKTLVLTPVNGGEKWSVNALSLKRLKNSGIETIRLVLGEMAIDVDTTWQPQGTIYAKLSAEGYVSKDYTLIVTADRITVRIENQIYIMNENNELVGE